MDPSNLFSCQGGTLLPRPRQAEEGINKVNRSAIHVALVSQVHSKSRDFFIYYLLCLCVDPQNGFIFSFIPKNRATGLEIYQTETFSFLLLLVRGNEGQASVFVFSPRFFPPSPPIPRMSTNDDSYCNKSFRSFSPFHWVKSFILGCFFKRSLCCRGCFCRRRRLKCNRVGRFCGDGF